MVFSHSFSLGCEFCPSPGTARVPGCGTLGGWAVLCSLLAFDVSGSSWRVSLLFLWIYGMVFAVVYLVGFGFLFYLLKWIYRAESGVSFIHSKKRGQYYFCLLSPSNSSSLSWGKKAVQMPLPFCWVFIKGAVCDLDFLACHIYSLVTSWFLITPRYFRPIFFSKCTAVYSLGDYYMSPSLSII